MSSNIWTRAELSASSLVIEAVAWRAVEAQHRVSTMKLVDSLAEQAALERVLEATKPAVPADCTRLHYLLYSPFRYARSNPYASRFRRANAPEGVFYASASPETAIAEIVFYRFLFYAESPDTPLPGNPAEYTVFAVQLRADPGLDLTRPPMSAHLEYLDGCERLRAVPCARGRGAEGAGRGDLLSVCPRSAASAELCRADAQGIRAKRAACLSELAHSSAW